MKRVSAALLVSGGIFQDSFEQYFAMLFGQCPYPADNAAARPSRTDVQGQLLRAHCESFDIGSLVHALAIATSLRVLLHDGALGVSLLQQIGLKTELPFVNTSGPEGNMFPQLCRMTVYSGSATPCGLPHTAIYQFLV